MEIVSQDHQGGIAASQGPVGHSVRGDSMSHPWRSFNTTLEITIFEELRTNKPKPRGDRVLEKLRASLPRKEEF